MKTQTIEIGQGLAAYNKVHNPWLRVFNAQHFTSKLALATVIKT